MSSILNEVDFFRPTQILGCQMWLDGADVNGNGITPSNGATVSTWVDKSGQGNSATASVAGTYTTARRAVTFNNSFYTTPYPANPTNETGFYVFLTTSSGGPQMLLGANSGGREIAIYNNGNQFGIINSLTAWGAITDGGTITTNTLYLATSRISGGTSTSIALNGALSFTGPVTVPAFTAGVLTSLGREAGTSFPFLGNLHEIIIFNSILSDSQQQQVEGYLAWKWGLQASLPATHPYRTSVIAPLLNPSSSLPVVIEQDFFIPTQISNCILWLDPSDSSTLTLSGTTVLSIQDKSSVASSFDQGTSKPISTRSINNLPTLNFPVANSANGIGTTNKTQYNNITQCSLFVINRPTFVSLAPGYNPGFFGLRSTTVTSVSWHVGSNYSGFIRWNGTSQQFPSLTIAQNEINLFEYIQGPTSFQTWKNGSGGGVITSTQPSQTGLPMSIGNSAIGNGEGFQGQIGEVIFYSRVLTTEEREQVEGYLAWRWGLQANLPSSHPYRNSILAPLLNPPSLPPQIVSAFWTPRSIPNCILWFDAADRSTITRSGTTVTSWQNKGTLSLSATTAIPSPRTEATGTVSYANFVFTTSRLNCMFFPGTTYLGILNVVTTQKTRVQAFIFSVTAFGDGYSRILCAADLTGTNQVGFNAWNRDGNSIQTFPGGFGGSELLGTGGQSPYSGTLPYNGTPFIMVWRHSTTLSENYISINGLQVAITANQALNNGYFTGTSNFLIGVGPGYTNSQFLGEVIQYDGGLTNLQLAQIEGYLAWKWGLVANLPINHPFKFYPPPPV